MNRLTYGQWLTQKLQSRRPIMKQTELADITKASRGYISALVNDYKTPTGGERLPSPELAEAIAMALNIDPATLEREINESRIMAGHNPRSPVTITYDADGTPTVSDPTEPAKVPADQSILDRLDRIEKLLASQIELTQQLLAAQRGQGS